MKVSINWVREINRAYRCSIDPAPNGIEDLVEKIGTQLGAVEEVIDVGKKYKGIVIAKVVKCDKHPNANKLKVCLIDDGGKFKNVKRTKDELIEVVCGAPNVKAGMMAVWIPPRNTVPSTYDKEPLILEAREIRGVVSNGMLASAKELALGDDHSGILEIDGDVKAGADFAKTFGLDDYIIDIENKMFTHRPDLFGMIGIARELAGIQHQRFKSPEWYREDAKLPADGRKNVLKLSVKNELPKLVPRFCAVAIKDVRVGPSPLWLRGYLSRIGIKPINNLVDISNYLMFETAQPIHIYDFDKVRKLAGGSMAEIVVRNPKKGEKITVLGGKVVIPSADTMMVAAGNHLICVGGIIGGANSEVDETTTNIIVEAANWDMNLIRKTAMELGLFTEAATRFTKNQSPLQNMAVIVKAVDDIKRLAGGRVASPTVDIFTKSAELKAHGQPSIHVTQDFINERLGLELPAKEMASLLGNVEFKVKISGENLQIEAPFWRTDIEIPEDIIEEIGRLYGYDHLPMELPSRDLNPAKLDALLSFKSKLRNILSAAGANEVLTYSFVHTRLLEAVGQDPKEAFHIRNALSPDLQYYRLSLTPSLLEKVHPNIKAGFDEFALYEIGKGHNKSMKDETEKDLPKEFEMLSLVFSSRNKSLKQAGSPLYEARKYLDYLAEEVSLELEYKPIEKEEQYQVAKPFDHNRSAQVWEIKSKLPLGMIGEYRQSVASSLKLPPYSAGFEIGIEQLLAASLPHRNYQPLNRFPPLVQDICLRTDVNRSYAELEEFVKEQLRLAAKEHGYIFELHPTDIFQRPNDKNHKQTTWRVILNHPERTLTTEEVNKVLDKIALAAKAKLKAERI